MKIGEHFPTLILTDTLPAARARQWNSRLKKEAYLFREQDDAGRKWSRQHYAAGYTSYSSITDLPFRSSSFRELKEWIDRHAHAFARKLRMDLMGGRLEMTTCWLNIMGRHSHHSFHVHPLSVFSGTYYVQVPRGSGAFRVEDPRMDCFMGAPPRRAPYQPHLSFNPRPGQLLMFESWMRHEVPANLSGQDRISVSFNYDWVRK